MDDDDWKNAINKLETNESKLLYLIYYIYKKNSITEQNKKHQATYSRLSTKADLLHQLVSAI